MKKCDSCDKPIEGDWFQAVDENFNPQEGVFYCGECAFGPEEFPEDFTEMNSNLVGAHKGNVITYDDGTH